MSTRRAAKAGRLAPYLAGFHARFRTGLQYRAAAWAGFSTQAAWGVIRIAVMAAFVLGNAHIESPMEIEALVAYIWLGQAMFFLIPWRTDVELSQLIRSGALAYELARPIDLYWFWFTRTAGAKLSGLVLRAIPLLLLAMVVLPALGLDEWALPLPAGWDSALAWIGMTVIAAAMSAAVTTAVSTTMFWTISGEGVAAVMPTFVIFFSGLIVPIPLFPVWAQPIFNALPFRAIADVPFRMYAGDIASNAFLPEAVFALGWTAAIIGFGRLLVRRGTRRVVIQGG